MEARCQAGGVAVKMQLWFALSIADHFDIPEIYRPDAGAQGFGGGFFGGPAGCQRRGPTTDVGQFLVGVDTAQEAITAKAL